MDLKKLTIRTLSGLVYVAIIIACILSGLVGISALACLLCVLGIIEFEKIFHGLSPRSIPTVILDVIGGVCLCLCYWQYSVPVWILCLLIRFILEIYLKSDTPHLDISRSVMAQIYIGLPLGTMPWIALETGSCNAVLLMFIFIWINDTGAFLVGSTLGRHRLFERVSPKKSWEGFFGGLCLNIVAAVLFCLLCPCFFGISGNLATWICLAVVATAFATWGDLFESLLKRHLHIKDSGNIIPGHGGILDRIDSLLFVMPSALLFFAAVKYL